MARTDGQTPNKTTPTTGQDSPDVEDKRNGENDRQQPSTFRRNLIITRTSQTEAQQIRTFGGIPSNEREIYQHETVP